MNVDLVFRLVFRRVVVVVVVVVVAEDDAAVVLLGDDLELGIEVAVLGPEGFVVAPSSIPMSPKRSKSIESKLLLLLLLLFLFLLELLFLVSFVVEVDLDLGAGESMVKPPKSPNSIPSSSNKPSFPPSNMSSKLKSSNEFTAGAASFVRLVRAIGGILARAVNPARHKCTQTAKTTTGAHEHGALITVCPHTPQSSDAKVTFAIRALLTTRRESERSKHG